MKIKKLLSIIMTMNNDHFFNMDHEKATAELKDAVNTMYEKINVLKNELEAEGLSFKQQKQALPKASSTLKLQVLDAQGKGTSAQVKCFPMKAGQTVKNYSKINGRIDMLLKRTDLQGNLEVELPQYTYCGFDKGKIEICRVFNYFIEISKGSEYEIIVDSVSVESEQEVPLIYRLNPLIDLKQEGWFAGDLHHHSIYSSPVYGGTDDVIESVEEVKIAMTSMGLSFGALSDHHNILNHKDWKNTQAPFFLPIPSKEISTSNGHVMALNVLEDVIYDIPPNEKRTKAYLLEEFIRITEQIKALGGLAQINHPRDMNPAISLSEGMTKHVALFDTMEIWNGSIPMLPGTTNDQAYHLWLGLLSEDRFIPATTGSDTHNTRADDYHEMLDELVWFVYHLKIWVSKNHSEEAYLKAAVYFIQLFEAALVALEPWAEENLGTGGVRTYIHCEVPLTPEKVLEALRKGSSFLTNGPILIPTLLGHGLGETVTHADRFDEVVVKCQVLSNRKLERIEVIGKKGILETIDMTHIQPNQKITLEVKVQISDLHRTDWIICRAYSDHTNQVITNPIFIIK